MEVNNNFYVKTPFIKEMELYIYFNVMAGGTTPSDTCFTVSLLDNYKEEKGFYNPERYEMYISLCKKHNDLNYVREVRFMEQGISIGYSYYDLDPVKLDIVSDADFDEKHPAGASLGDLFYFNSVIPYPFIKNGYQGPELTWIKQTLDKITPEEMILSIHDGYFLDEINPTRIDPPFFSLPMASFPTLSQKHNFTITIVDDYGRTFTGKTYIDFSTL